MTNKRILIVDDSPNLRKVTKRYVETSGTFIFFEADDGEQAETILQEQFHAGTPVDLLILDWHMPKVTGLELLRSLRSTEIFGKTPSVIMLTAETYAAQISACLEFHVSTYLTKPFSEEQIRTAVLKALADQSEVRHAI